jgi:hypothetical protein
VGPAVEVVAELATDDPDRPTCHGRAVAAPRLHELLGMEVTAAGRPASNRPGGSGVHSTDEPSESTLGQRASHPWRIAQAGHRGVAGDCGEVRAASTWSALTHWRAFLRNHVAELASIDFFTVPTATFRVLFVFVVLSHERRRILHPNVTAHPTAAWAANSSARHFPGIAPHAS